MLKKVKEIINLSWQAFGGYKWQIAFLTGLGFLSGVLGGIGINAVVPLFSFIVGTGSRSDDIVTKYIEKLFLYFNIDFTLKYLLVFIILLFILKAAVLVLFSYVEVRINTGYERRTRTNLFRMILDANWPYLLKQKLGHLEKVLMTNVSYCKNFLSNIGLYIKTITTLIAYTFVAINISPLITLITFGAGGMLIFIFKPLMRKVRRISYELEKINRDIAHHINENILGLKTIKAMSLSGIVADKGKEYFNRIRNISIRSYVLSIFSGSLMEPISVIFIAAVFVFAYKAPGFSLAALLAVMYLVKLIFSHITEIHSQLIAINAGIPYLKSIMNYQAEALEQKEKDKGIMPFNFKEAVEFRNVSFSYEPNKKVLSGVNFKIKKGEIVGLIGPSGAGKTTIVDLCLRLFEPSSGEILLDSTNISEISLRSWRDNIGYVSQDIFLANDTVCNNIKFYDETITDEQVQEAAKMANIYDFIKECPDGFSTMVGERGVLFSGGQRQRIIIARVLARKPKLLILDEATSALDNESELKIQQVIKGLKGKVTVFVIAHRLSTVMNSDRLMAVENGRIVEQGAPQQLLADKSSYFSKVYQLKNNFLE